MEIDMDEALRYAESICTKEAAGPVIISVEEDGMHITSGDVKVP